MRDLVIGVTIVLADGTVARSGGHVIKNVAGYDLAKVLHGSYGTLGVLAEVVLRLHPVPKRTATLAIHCSLEEAAEHAATVLGGPYEPAAMEWTSDGVLLIRLEGTEEALGARLEHLRTALGSGELLDLPPDSDESAVRRIGTDERAARRNEAWERHASLVRGDPALASLRIGVRPSRLPSVLADLPAETMTAGLGTGVATVALPVEAVAEAHARVHAAGGTSVLRSRPAEADAAAWGPTPSAIAVLRAVKAELDSQGRFGPGRFDPWM
jgi:glycolate oxidase FAD binding subunit